MISRISIGVALFVVMVWWLSGIAIPGWLLIVVLVVAMPFAIVAGVEQKRMERKLARSVWNAVTRR